MTYKAVHFSAVNPVSSKTDITNLKGKRKQNMVVYSYIKDNKVKNEILSQVLSNKVQEIYLEPFMCSLVSQVINHLSLVIVLSEVSALVEFNKKFNKN